MLKEGTKMMPTQCNNARHQGYGDRFYSFTAFEWNSLSADLFPDSWNLGLFEAWVSSTSSSLSIRWDEGQIRAYLINKKNVLVVLNAKVFLSTLLYSGTLTESQRPCLRKQESSKPYFSVRYKHFMVTTTIWIRYIWSRWWRSTREKV